MKHFTKLILYYQSSSTVLYTQTTYLNFSGITEKVIICTAGHNCTGRECGHMYVRNRGQLILSAWKPLQLAMYNLVNKCLCTIIIISCDLLEVAWYVIELDQ